MNTLKFGNGEWYGKKDTILAYNDLNSNFKPLPFSFDRASSATRVNKDGLIETVGSGEPRIDYKNDSKGALKLEPSRTNYVNNSNNASLWSSITSGGTITRASNYAISPDGTQNATRLQASVSGSGYALITLAITSAFDGNYTSTVYVKSNTNSNQKIAFYGRNSTNNAHTVGNEWTRIEFQGSSASGQSQLSYLGVSTSVTNEDNPIDILVWGGQLEQGYATSYIPTSGGAVTRVADACNNENLNVDYSGDYTLYLEHETLSITEYNQFQFRQETSISYIFRVGNSINIGTNLYTAANTIGFNKFALSVTSIGSYKFYKNGVLLSSGSGLNANLETLRNDALGMNIKEIKLYNTALTDQELINLTSN